MISTELTEWFNARWFGDMGAIDGQDVAFIADLIAEAKPRTVVEIGCASGMSSCVLASLMSHNGGGALHSFDLLDHYYVDPTKPVGYMIDEALPHPGVTITVHRGKTCLDVGEHIQEPIDLCFIDAAHKHPWPLIDTLGILPLVKPGGIIIHHDLKMYCSTWGNSYATGPRHVFDQAPVHSRIFPTDDNQALGRSLMKSRSVSHNIFALRVPETGRAYGARLGEGFFLGWDKQEHRLIPLAFASRFQAFIGENYGPWVGQAFAEGMRRYSDPPEAPQAPVAPLKPGFVRRVLRKINVR
ncbi:MAG: class I SAM-dependent methyltransferase [Paracoccaceae bacterium]